MKPQAFSISNTESSAIGTSVCVPPLSWEGAAVVVTPSHVNFIPKSLQPKPETAR